MTKRKVPSCPYCGKQSACRDSSAIYTKSRGWVWMCPDYPTCDSYVGCHKRTKIPLGRMANSKLRALRRRAHSAFDSLWKSGVRTRSQAYRWLAEELRIPKSECHVAMFDEKTCEDVIAACKNAPHRRIERVLNEVSE